MFYFEFFKTGKPGAKLTKEFDKLIKALTLPKIVLDELGISIKQDVYTPVTSLKDIAERGAELWQGRPECSIRRWQVLHFPIVLQDDADAQESQARFFDRL
jgi:hypothetical protein